MPIQSLRQVCERCAPLAGSSWNGSATMAVTACCMRTSARTLRVGRFAAPSGSSAARSASIWRRSLHISGSISKIAWHPSCRRETKKNEHWSLPRVHVFRWRRLRVVSVRSSPQNTEAHLHRNRPARPRGPRKLFRKIRLWPLSSRSRIQSSQIHQTILSHVENNLASIARLPYMGRQFFRKCHIQMMGVVSCENVQRTLRSYWTGSDDRGVRLALQSARSHPGNKRLGLTGRPSCQVMQCAARYSSV